MGVEKRASQIKLWMMEMAKIPPKSILSLFVTERLRADCSDILCHLLAQLKRKISSPVPWVHMRHARMEQVRLILHLK